MFEFLRKTPTVVGLDISSTAVKLLELSQDKGQYRVESYGVEVIPENAIVEKNIADIDAVGGAIKRVRQKSKTKVKEVGVAVAGSSVITKTLELAASLSEAQIEEQLLDDADKYIPYPLDEVAMDFQIRRDSIFSRRQAASSTSTDSPSGSWSRRIWKSIATSSRG